MEAGKEAYVAKTNEVRRRLVSSSYWLEVESQDSDFADGEGPGECRPFVVEGAGDTLLAVTAEAPKMSMKMQQSVEEGSVD